MSAELDKRKGLNQHHLELGEGVGGRDRKIGVAAVGRMANVMINPHKVMAGGNTVTVGHSRCNQALAEASRSGAHSPAPVAPKSLIDRPVSTPSFSSGPCVSTSEEFVLFLQFLAIKRFHLLNKTF